MHTTTVGSKTLFPHQITAVKWMIEKEAEGGGFLCDEMGLGKTLTTIAFLLNMKSCFTLILAPLAVIDQWISALKDTSLAIHTFKKDWNYVSGNVKNGSVYITNYDKLISNPSFFKKRWGRIICDEAHILRNSKSEKYKALKRIKTNSHWFLTGTPVVNRLSDFGSLMHLVKPSVSASNLGKPQAITCMGDFALQRTVMQIRDQMSSVLPPDPIVHDHKLEFTTDEEQIFYRGIQGHIADALQHLMEQDRIDMIEFLALLTRLRQLSTHPQIYISSRKKQLGKSYLRPDWIGGSTKTDKIIDIMKEKGKHGYVIFCHFDEEIQIIKKILEKEGNCSKILVYNGSMTPQKRTSVLEEAQKSMKPSFGSYILDKAEHLPLLPEDIHNHVIRPYLGSGHVVLLAQIQTAGTGLNLQFMDRIIFTSSWWTAALMDQAVGRIVRLGQKKQVHVHHLTLKEDEAINIDEYINERVEVKRDLCTELLAAANHSL